MRLIADGHRDDRRRAFTLVELLVVIAVIALLVGVLLPALGRARASGQQAQAANNQRQLVLGMTAWSNEHDLDIPGLNTSGLKLEEWQAEPDKLDRSSEIPVQNWDWISPAVGPDNFSADRAQRFVECLEKFADPTQGEIVQSGEFRNASPELVEAIDEVGGVTAPSFLMPASFQWAGQTIEGEDPVTGQTETIQYGQPDEEGSYFDLPAGWFPSLGP